MVAHCHLTGLAGARVWRCGCRHAGSRHQVVVNKHLPAAQQAGIAGTDAANSRQVGMMQDWQLD